MEASWIYQETVDCDTFHPADPAEGDRAEPAQPSQPLPLPLPAPSNGGAPQLGLGERVQMDHLGPLVIGEDGSVGRIANCEWPPPGVRLLRCCAGGSGGRALPHAWAAGCVLPLRAFAWRCCPHSKLLLPNAVVFHAPALGRMQGPS